MKHRWLIAADRRDHVGGCRLRLRQQDGDDQRPRRRLRRRHRAPRGRHRAAPLRRRPRRVVRPAAAPTTAAAGSTPTNSTPVGSTPGAALKIVSLSPTATEMLFAIGAGDQVVAVDDYSNYPAEALAKSHDLSGYDPSVEAVGGSSPTSSSSPTRPTASATQLATGSTFCGGPPAATTSTTSTPSSSSSARPPATWPRRRRWSAEMQADIEAAVGGVVERAAG